MSIPPLYCKCRLSQKVPIISSVNTTKEIETTEKAISLQQKLARDRSPSLGRFLNRSLNMLLPFMVGLKIPFMSEETPKARCWFDVKDSACPGRFNGDPHAKS